MAERIEVPVLVVGAGPVGTCAAILLGRQGLGSLVVERRAGLDPAPAAHVVNARTFEVLRSAGVDMSVVAAACKDPREAGCVRFLTSLFGEELGRLPFERQGDDVRALTPTPLRNLSQHRLEPILLSRLGKEDRARVAFSHVWEASVQDDTGVTSQVRDVSSGRTVLVRSRYVLAADGAGSRVRKSLGIEAVGPSRLGSFVMMHFEADLRERLAERPAVLYFVARPGSTGTFVAHDLGATWVYMHPFDPDRESLEDFDERRCAGIVRRAMGDPAFEPAFRTIRTWHMTAQVAERYREGRIFLVGDAAHRFPPTGGLGLNSGVQDVHNLAWKLGAVEAGWAAPTLLDSYESERRGVARTNCEVSLRNAIRLMQVYQALGLDPASPIREEDYAQLLRDPGRCETVRAAIAGQAEHFDMLGLQLGFHYTEGAVVSDGSPEPSGHDPVREYRPSGRPGGRLPHAWIGDPADDRSTLDLVPCATPVLVTGSEGGAWAEAAAELEVPLGLVRIGRELADRDGAWRALLGIDPDGAVLVRPDQHVAWRSVGATADPAATLAAVTTQIFGK